MRVVIAAGGTAGHVFPALALARHLRAAGAEVVFAGTAGGPEARVARAEGFGFAAVQARPFPRKVSTGALRAPLAAAQGVRACRPLVDRADVVVGMGGYVSVPPVLAALAARRPVVLHEQNAVAGLANRLFARWARRIGLSFAEAAATLPGRARAVVTGNPVREEIVAVRERRADLADEARAALGLEPGRRTVVVFGGSQGARRIDEAAAGAARLLGDRGDLQLLVLTGEAHRGMVEEADGAGGRLRVRALPFLDRMELAYAAADLVVARAGASSIAEITVCGLPAILVPYPYATANHQEANARAVERAGAAVVLRDVELTPRVLGTRIAALLEDPATLARMAERATAWGKPDAAARVAELVEEAAG
ncbi:MAG TPA: undecaprenyldiphospho-muramoylpentapeptide beta-N-acetylglucosaminyltransferase [Actinomycetota bacterium]|nr:undecaprenyldiphospho-muramoylpentapeptide beta-N-acetylglucosaminyltransferase [Actinomycetota bacterium]